MSTGDIANAIYALYATLAASSPAAGDSAAGDPCWPVEDWQSFDHAISSIDANTDAHDAAVSASNAALDMVTTAIQAGIRWGAAMAAASLMAAPPDRE